MNRKKWLIYALIIMCVSSAAFDGLFYLRNVGSESSTVTLAELLSTFLIALWVDADSKERPQIFRPFEYGYLAWVFLIPYLPYYLWRTRGPLGLLMLAGFIGLFYTGSILKLMIYYLAR